MEWRIPLADVDVGEEEIKAVTKVLKSKWLTMNGVTQEFEHYFAEKIKVRYAFAVTNCTAALHLANIVLGVAVAPVAQHHLGGGSCAMDTVFLRVEAETFMVPAVAGMTAEVQNPLRVQPDKFRFEERLVNCLYPVSRCQRIHPPRF